MRARVYFCLVIVLLVLVGCSAPPKKTTSESSSSKEASPPQVAAKKEPVQPVEKPVEKAAVKQVEAPKPTPAPVVKKQEPPKPLVKVEKPSEPAKAVKHELPTDANTFLVVTEHKTSNHPDFGKGSEHGFTVNGVQGKEIVVYRGEEYTFRVDTGVKHDFYFTTNPAGWGTAAYSEGVTGQFTYAGDVKLKPNVATPDVLYYQCRNHKNMGGKIYVLDKGEDLAAVKAKEKTSTASFSAGAGAQTQSATEKSVKQKISYADMLLMGQSAKKVEASGNAKAMASLKQAKADIADAKTLMAGGSYDEALKKANAGIRLVMTASMAAASSSTTVDNSAQKAEYNELLDALKTYENSYERNVKRAKKSGQTLKATLNKSEYESLVSKGKSLAQRDDYSGANTSLKKAQTMITNTLTAMLQSQTLVYDKNFETPKEEYEYELARTESYEELIPLAVEQRRPSKGLMSLMNRYVDRAKEIKAEGLEIVASKGDYKMGIMAMQAATDNLIRALRTVGVQ